MTEDHVYDVKLFIWQVSSAILMLLNYSWIINVTKTIPILTWLPPETVGLFVLDLVKHP